MQDQPPLSQRETSSCTVCQRPTATPHLTVPLTFLVIVGHRVRKVPLRSSVQRANWRIGAVFSVLGRFNAVASCCSSCEVDLRKKISSEVASAYKTERIARRTFAGMCVVAILLSAYFLPKFDNQHGSFGQAFLAVFLPIILLLVGGLGIAGSGARRRKIEKKKPKMDDLLAGSAGIKARISAVASKMDLSGIRFRLNYLSHMGVDERSPCEKQQNLLFLLDQTRDWGFGQTIKGKGVYGGHFHYDRYDDRSWWESGHAPEGFDNRGEKGTFKMEVTERYYSDDQFGRLFQDDEGLHKIIE